MAWVRVMVIEMIRTRTNRVTKGPSRVVKPRIVVICEREALRPNFLLC